MILAGGLSPENVTDGILKVLPAGADSCTRTNSLDGNGRPVRFMKDFEKVARFVEEVRRAEGLIRGMALDLRTEIRSLERKRDMAGASLSPGPSLPGRQMALGALEAGDSVKVQGVREALSYLWKLC